MAAPSPLANREGELYLVDGSADSRQLVAREVECHFEKLREPVYVYVFSICRNAHYAEEITQDVFLRLYKSLSSGERITNIRGWVYRVAHNLAINESKKRRFELLRGASENAWGTAPDPEQILLDGERYSRYRRGLESLTEHQRYCLQLRAEGFHHHQIAEILNISRAGVVDVLQRAMKRLRKAIE